MTPSIPLPPTEPVVFNKITLLLIKFIYIYIYIISIEDALAALLLYKQYRDLTDKNEFDTVLADVYNQGHRTGWNIETLKKLKLELKKKKEMKAEST